MTVRMSTRTAPTERSLAYLRSRGCIVDYSEHKQGKATYDWGGAFDITGVTREGRFVAVQTTSIGNIASRIAKVRRCPDLAALLARGAVLEVHGWEPESVEPRVERLAP
jgi:hypothetical protein